MPIDHGKVFGKAFRYAFSYNRVMPYFLINLVIMAGILMLFISFVNVIPYLTTRSPQFLASLSSVISVFLGFILIAIMLMLVKLFFDAAVTDNAKLYWQGRNRFLSASYGIAKKKYLSVLGATIIVALISFAVSLIPIAGIIIAIIISWVFFFIIPAVVISGNSAADSLGDSYKVFKSNKLNTVVFWLLLILISFLILIIALIPIIIAAFPIIIKALEIFITRGSILSLIPLIQQNLVNLVIAGVVSSVIIAYMLVFQSASIAFFYLSAKKR